MHAAPLNIGLVQILQGENPSFVGDLLDGEVKLGHLMFGPKAKSKKRKKGAYLWGALGIVCWFLFLLLLNLLFLHK